MCIKLIDPDVAGFSIPCVRFWNAFCLQTVAAVSVLEVFVRVRTLQDDIDIASMQDEGGS